MYSLEVGHEVITQILKSETSQDLLEYTLYRAKNSHVVIFFNGDGARGDFQNIPEQLISLRLNYDYVTFYYRGVREGKERSINDYIIDAQELLEHFRADRDYTSYVFIATSAGASVVANIVPEPIVPVSQVILIDPADYYVSPIGSTGLTWDGESEYLPENPVFSDSMKSIDSSVEKVDVIGFSLKNTLNHQYAPHEKRHIDQEGYYSRLNQQMVRAFYDKVPDVQKGKFRSVNEIPHAFMRDGNIRKNIRSLVRLLTNLLR